jgi:hypothetical protein
VQQVVDRSRHAWCRDAEQQRPNGGRFHAAAPTTWSLTRRCRAMMPTTLWPPGTAIESLGGLQVTTDVDRRRWLPPRLSPPWVTTRPTIRIVWPGHLWPTHQRSGMSDSYEAPAPRPAARHSRMARLTPCSPVHLAGWRSERQLSWQFLPRGRLADGAWPVESGESAVPVTAASRGSRTSSNPRSHHGGLHGLGRGTGNPATPPRRSCSDHPDSWRRCRFHAQEVDQRAQHPVSAGWPVTQNKAPGGATRQVRK